MSKMPLTCTAVALLLACWCGDGAACGDPVAILGDLTVEFSRTYTGNYRHGQPYDYVTIDPAGTGETFASAGITFRVCLRCTTMQGSEPLVDWPANLIVLYARSLSLCSPLPIADHATDLNGCTEFTGTIRGGGCTEDLQLFVEGIPVHLYSNGIRVDAVPVKINSTDAGTSSPLFWERLPLGD